MGLILLNPILSSPHRQGRTYLFYPEGGVLRPVDRIQRKAGRSESVQSPRTQRETFKQTDMHERARRLWHQARALGIILLEKPLWLQRSQMRMRGLAGEVVRHRGQRDLGVRVVGTGLHWLVEEVGGAVRPQVLVERDGWDRDQGQTLTRYYIYFPMMMRFSVTSWYK